MVKIRICGGFSQKNKILTLTCKAADSGLKEEFNEKIWEMVTFSKTSMTLSGRDLSTKTFIGILKPRTPLYQI